MIPPCTRALNLESHCDRNLSPADSSSAAGSMDKWRRPTIMDPIDVAFPSLRKSPTAI